MPVAGTTHPWCFEHGFAFYASPQKSSRTSQAAAAAFCFPTFGLRDDLYKLIILSCITVQVVLHHGSLDDSWSFVLASELEREDCSERFCSFSVQ